MSKWKANLFTILFAASIMGGAVGVTHLHRWSVRCREETNRCSQQEKEWEQISKNLQIVATEFSRKARENPRESATYSRWAKRDSYLSVQARKIAHLYRAEATQWGWWMGADDSKNRIRELWIEPE